MKINGPILVAIGAISYGVPATLIKLSQSQTDHTIPIIFFMFFFSMIFLVVLSLISRSKTKVSISWKDKGALIISGISIAITNICYFYSLLYSQVAVSAVMLMQSVWISIAIGCLLKRQLPTKIQYLIVLLILFGTILATNVLNISEPISSTGLILAFISAVSYAFTIQFTSKLCLKLPAIKRSALMSIGSFIFIAVIWGNNVVTDKFIIELKWGMILSIFAMIIPLICFSFGMPKTNHAVGEIITSMELPSSIIFAFLFVNEQVNLVQIMGVIIILGAIILSVFTRSKNSVNNSHNIIE